MSSEDDGALETCIKYSRLVFLCQLSSVYDNRKLSHILLFLNFSFSPSWRGFIPFLSIKC